MNRTVHFRTAVALAAAVLTLPPPALADCGSIPFYAPVVSEFDLVTNDKDRSINFNPLSVSVFEPKQRALILWNGQEQILLLSTDQKATEQSHVLEVIPLPGQPTVRLGSFETFERAQKLVVEKRMWAVAHGGAAAGSVAVPPAAGRITFAERMGAHNLAVAEVIDAGRFTGFVQDFLRQHYRTADAPIRPDFVKVIQSYLDEGFRWFAFDVIELGSSLRSREPVEYRFKTDRVYYPLRISSLERGRTNVDLLVFTPGGVSQVGPKPTQDMTVEPRVSLAPSDIAEVNPEWAGFFGSATTLAMDQWRIDGQSSELLRDVAAK